MNIQFMNYDLQFKVIHNAGESTNLSTETYNVKCLLNLFVIVLEKGKSICFQQLQLIFIQHLCHRSWVEKFFLI